MVIPEPETVPSQGEVESALQLDQQQKNNGHPFSSLGRQSSVYSLTLDEFQHTLCERGKNFGSMNMDEFLASIRTAEENEAINSSSNNNINNSNNGNNCLNGNAGDHTNFSLGEVTSTEKGGVIARKASLTRQGSLTLPAPLCRKTVDEVWSEIHSKGQQDQNQRGGNNDNNARNSDYTPRQPTFGEMTLEDFLIKAGVVREQPPLAAPAPPPPSKPQQYGMYTSNAAAGVPGFVSRPTAMATGGAGGGGSAGGVAAYTMPQAGMAFGGDSSVYVGNGARNGPYASPPPPVAAAAGCYSGRVVNGGGGYGAGQPLRLQAPVSPVSSDGICASQVDNSGGQFGLDIGALRGRKRIIDGPVEKVVERRQRRMIKNRESAARSRARKQAYAVELEAELNQLREENAHLKQALAELEGKQKQHSKGQTKAYRANKKLRLFRRTLSYPL